MGAAAQPCLSLVVLVIVKHHCGCSQERLCQDVLCMAQQSTMGWAAEIIPSRFRYFVLLSALDKIFEY